MKDTTIKKQYLVTYRNVTYVVRFINNQFWRWSMDYQEGVKDFPIFSHKSNALTHRGAIKTMNSDIDGVLRDMKRAGFFDNVLQMAAEQAMEKAK